VPVEKATGGAVALTGHRNYVDRAAMYRALDKIKAEKYYLGGARGFDTDALEYLAKTQPATIRTVVVPNRLIDQPTSAQEATRIYASEVIEMKNTGPGRYQVRNRYMVDHADRLEAFYDGRQTGGTVNTMNYAESKGVPVDINPLIEFDKNVIMEKSEGDFLEWLRDCERAAVSKMSVKSLVTVYLQKIPRERWKEILEQLHRLK
jgi:hypothetical protein